MNISNIMIHINESLSEEARTALEDAMRKIEGVVSPRFNASKEHLLLIAYNTEKLTPQSYWRKPGQQATPRNWWACKCGNI